MPFVCQTVKDRNACVFVQFFHSFLFVAAEFDRVVHRSEYAGCILNAFLVTDLRALRIKESGVGALIIGSDFKSAAGTSGGLFEDQSDALSLQMLYFSTGLFCLFKIFSKTDEIIDFFSCVIDKAQK